MSKPIQVRVLASDIRNTQYESRDDCALARAIKRDFSFTVSKVNVGGHIVDIDGKLFAVNREDSIKLQSMYEHCSCNVLPKRRMIEPEDFNVILLPVEC